MSAKRKPPAHVLSSEDVRWLNMVRRTVDGLAAMAEAMAEGCDTEWIAMQSSLETLRDTVDSILKDYKDRIKEAVDE